MPAIAGCERPIGRGLVVDTGMRTQLGLIADMLQSVENEETPLQRRLDQLDAYLLQLKEQRQND